MSNLVEWINKMSENEPVEAVVIGEMGWGDFNAAPNYAEQPRAKVISWDEAKKWLDYEFDDGYGAPRCNVIYAWTKSWIIAVYQYDGSTGPFRVPRNPRDIMPYMPGG